MFHTMIISKKYNNLLPVLLQLDVWR